MPEPYDENKTYPQYNKTDESNNANKPWRKFEMYGLEYRSKSFLYLPDKKGKEQWKN